MQARLVRSLTCAWRTLFIMSLPFSYDPIRSPGGRSFSCPTCSLRYWNGPDLSVCPLCNNWCVTWVSGSLTGPMAGSPVSPGSKNTEELMQGSRDGHGMDRKNNVKETTLQLLFADSRMSMAGSERVVLPPRSILSNISSPFTPGSMVTTCAGNSPFFSLNELDVLYMMPKSENLALIQLYYEQLEPFRDQFEYGNSAIIWLAITKLTRNFSVIIPAMFQLPKAMDGQNGYESVFRAFGFQTIDLISKSDRCHEWFLDSNLKWTQFHLAIMRRWSESSSYVTMYAKLYVEIVPKINALMLPSNFSQNQTPYFAQRPSGRSSRTAQYMEQSPFQLSPSRQYFPFMPNGVTDPQPLFSREPVTVPFYPASRDNIASNYADIFTVEPARCAKASDECIESLNAMHLKLQDGDGVKHHTPVANLLPKFATFSPLYSIKSAYSSNHSSEMRFGFARDANSNIHKHQILDEMEQLDCVQSPTFLNDFDVPVFKSTLKHYGYHD